MALKVLSERFVRIGESDLNKFNPSYKESEIQVLVVHSLEKATDPTY